MTEMCKNWHPECFKCAICGVNLQDEGFVQDDSTGQLLCEKHYNSMFAPPCYKCNQRIVGVCFLIHILGSESSLME